MVEHLSEKGKTENTLPLPLHFVQFEGTPRKPFSQPEFSYKEDYHERSQNYPRRGSISH
jgi:hypothetical protein